MELPVVTPGYRGDFLFQYASSAGDTFKNSGETVLFFKNGGGSSINVLIAPDPIGNLAFATIVVPIAAGQVVAIGSFLPELFNGANGSVSLTYSSVTNLLVGACHIGRSKERSTAALSWVGSKWEIDTNGRAYNAPELLEDITINGNMEIGAPPSSWSGNASAVLSASTERTGGSGSRSLNVVRGTNDYAALQTQTGVVGDWYKMEWWLRVLTGGQAAIFQSGSADLLTFVTTATWLYGKTTTRRTTATSQTRLYTKGTAEFDDISLRRIVTPSLFASINGSAPLRTIGAAINTCNAREIFGIVSCLDNPNNPKNFVMGIWDDGFWKLEKCVGGVYTQLQSVAGVFVADAVAEIRWVTGTSCEFWYGNALIGSVQTINDAGIVGNSHYGVISSDSENKFSTGLLDGQVVLFSFPTQSPNWIALYAIGDSKTDGDTWVSLLVADLSVAADAYAYEMLPRGGVPGHTTEEMANDIDAFLALFVNVSSHITINLGANDVGALPTEATWKTDMAYIIDAVRSKWPSVQIYVARPWRRGYATQCNTLAVWINDIVSSYPSGVHLGMDERIWLENGDDGATYTTDGIHYTVSAQQVCADAWRAAIGY